MEIIKIVTLALSGLLLLFVGIMRISNPIKTYSKNSGITIADDVNLLNEVRGVSAVMLFGGIIILLGTIFSQLTVISFTVATLILIGFAIGRLLSMATDGQPNKMIVQGLMFELVLGAANIFCLLNI